MATRRPKKESQRTVFGRFKLTIDGSSLHGEKTVNGWEWIVSSDMIDLAEKYQRSEDVAGIVAEFTARCLKAE